MMKLILIFVMLLMSSCVSLYYEREYLIPASGANSEEDSFLKEESEFKIGIKVYGVLYKREVSFFKHHEIDKGPFQFTFNIKNIAKRESPVLNIVYITIQDTRSEIIYLEENITVNLSQSIQAQSFSDSNMLHIPSFGEYSTDWIDDLSIDEEYLLTFAYLENDEVKTIKVKYKIWSYYLDEYASAFHYWAGF